MLLWVGVRIVLPNLIGLQLRAAGLASHPGEGSAPRMQRGAHQWGAAAWASGPATADFRASGSAAADIRVGLVRGRGPASAWNHICHHHLPPQFSRPIFCSRGSAGDDSSSSLLRPYHPFGPVRHQTGSLARSLARRHACRPPQIP